MRDVFRKAAALVSKHALIAFKTTHIDRAGETGIQTVKCGEIVALDTSGWVVIDAEEGEHLRCPASKLYRTPPGIRFLKPQRGQAVMDYFAAEELIRNFLSARRPVVLRWLDRQGAMALCRSEKNSSLES
jgi:hypothetical protein